VDRDEKTREDRLRHLARRKGLRLVKSRSRNPETVGFGHYKIIDPDRNWVVAGTGNGSEPLFNLDDVEEYLTA